MASRVVTERMMVVVDAHNRTPTHNSGRELSPEGQRRLVKDIAAAQLEELRKSFPGMTCRVLFDGIPEAGSVPDGR